jgi:hypothetical protein
MYVIWKGKSGTWREIADAARTTVNMVEGTKEPTEKWKKQMLLAEHSPIRKLKVSWKWYDLFYWVSTHFVRHKFGIDHFIRTQRTDRTGVDRNIIPQGAFVEHECEANAQAIINISRKRLCRKASPETQDAWKMFLAILLDNEPELFSVCVPECIYRGFCPELETCGYVWTTKYEQNLRDYRKVI